MQGVLRVIEDPGVPPLPHPGVQALGDALGLGPVEERQQRARAPVLRAQAVDGRDRLFDFLRCLGAPGPTGEQLDQVVQVVGVPGG